MISKRLDMVRDAYQSNNIDESKKVHVISVKIGL